MAGKKSIGQSDKNKQQRQMWVNIIKQRYETDKGQSTLNFILFPIFNTISTLSVYQFFFRTKYFIEIDKTIIKWIMAMENCTTQVNKAHKLRD